MSGVRFYCGIGEDNWNKTPVLPGLYACISPVYGKTKRTHTINRVSVPTYTQVIQDSGAFSDSADRRLTFQAALDRQVAHAARFGYANQITHRASYDLLIDEVWNDGNRTKRRWSESAAAEAVDTTVSAARFLSQHREGASLILSAQGVTADQYLGCVKRIVPLLVPGDVLGLGGWCIIGKLPAQMLPTFRETILKVIPFAAKREVKQVHIWGVIFPQALGELLWLCDQHGIALSTDSAGPSVKPCFGAWGYAEWRDKDYRRPPVETRGSERARHVNATRLWLDRLGDTQHYVSPGVEYKENRLTTKRKQQVAAGQLYMF